MPQSVILDLARNALITTTMLAGPLLLVALVVGLIVSIIQAVTQIQEQTLTFIPKLAAIGVVFLIALPWLMNTMVRYTVELFRSIPAMAN